MKPLTIALVVSACFAVAMLLMGSVPVLSNRVILKKHSKHQHHHQQQDEQQQHPPPRGQIAAEKALSLLKKKDKDAVILFHARWCNACSNYQQRFPAFQKSSRGKAVLKQIEYVTVEQKEMSTGLLDLVRNHLKGYPTFAVIKNGHVDYKVGVPRDISKIFESWES